jgi:hypothetical protein
MRKLALTSPTSGGRSIGIVRSRTQATEFFMPVYREMRALNWYRSEIFIKDLNEQVYNVHSSVEFLQFLNFFLFGAKWNQVYYYWGHYCTCPGWWWMSFGGSGGMTDRGNWSSRRKPAPMPLCPLQIPHDRTRAATVGDRQLTAWAMVRTAPSPGVDVKRRAYQTNKVKAVLTPELHWLLRDIGTHFLAPYVPAQKGSA